MLFKSLQSIGSSQLTNTINSTQFGSISNQLLAVAACIDLNLAPLLSAHNHYNQSAQLNQLPQKSQLTNTMSSSQFGSNSNQLLAFSACIDLNLAPLLSAHVDADIRT
ncbi:hypothetical protein ACTFIY_004777 [Dictyostelium cf. discoideum]